MSATPRRPKRPRPRNQDTRSAAAEDTEEDVEDVDPRDARAGAPPTLSTWLKLLTLNADLVEGDARAHHPDAATREAFRACNRWAPLVRMLLAQRPDVLCLQEVCEEAARPGSAFRAALEAGGLTLAGQAFCPMVVVPTAARRSGDEEGAESTKPALTARRCTLLWVRQGATAAGGHLELLPQRQAPSAGSTWVSDGDYGIAGGGVVALVRLQRRFVVGLAGVHFQWGGKSTLFLKSKAKDLLTCTVPSDHGQRGAFTRALDAELPEREFYVSGQLLRQQQTRAVALALERVLRERGLRQDPQGWLSPCLLLGDTNWRPSEVAAAGGLVADEGSCLYGPPWCEAPGAEARATYPFSPTWHERYLPRYDRVLVRSQGAFWGSSFAREHAGRVGVTRADAEGALLQARPAKHGLVHMTGDAACPPLLRGRPLSDHWGVAVRVELWLK